MTETQIGLHVENPATEEGFGENFPDHFTAEKLGPALRVISLHPEKNAGRCGE